MAKGIKRRLLRTIKRVRAHISVSTDQSNKFSRGLSGEGYAGGYIAALNDVLLVLNGVEPQDHWGFWREDDDHAR